MPITQRRKVEAGVLLCVLIWAAWTLLPSSSFGSHDAAVVVRNNEASHLKPTPQLLPDDVTATMMTTGGGDDDDAASVSSSSSSTPSPAETNEDEEQALHHATSAFHTITNEAAAEDDSSPIAKKENVHSRLFRLAKRVSHAITSSRARHYSRHGVSHFVGGMQQFTRAMHWRNWTYHPPSQLNAYLLKHHALAPQHNATAFPRLPDTLDLVFLPCYVSKPALQDAKHRGLVGVVSGDPDEQRAVIKGDFYLAVREWYAKHRPGCDYRGFHPETHYLGSQQDCVQFNTSLVRPNELWFLKQSSRASFGTGITLLRHDTVNSGKLAAACDKIDFARTPMLMQRGVTDIITYDGRVTQGRAYLLVSSYKPISRAWFFMGYFNVAAGKSHVTNTGANQASDRITFYDVLQQQQKQRLDGSKSKLDRFRRQVKHNVKVAAQELFHVVQSRVGGGEERTFSLFGFDYVIREDGTVVVLEANCNCELFFDEKEFGPVRYKSSTKLVNTMMDLVIASNLKEEEGQQGSDKTAAYHGKGEGEAFNQVLEQFVAEEDQALRDVQQSNALDKDGVRLFWELLYSSDRPKFAYADLGACT